MTEKSNNKSISDENAYFSVEKFYLAGAYPVEKSALIPML